MLIERVDAEGAIVAWATTVAGPTTPLAGGVHLGKPRIPSAGAIGELSLATPRRADDITDDVRAIFTVRATGGEQRAREVAEHAARWLADQIDDTVNTRHVVTTRRGDSVRIVVGGDVNGPVFTGQSGGEAQYTIDALFRFHPA